MAYLYDLDSEPVTNDALQKDANFVQQCREDLNATIEMLIRKPVASGKQDLVGILKDRVDEMHSAYINNKQLWSMYYKQQMQRMDEIRESQVKDLELQVAGLTKRLWEEQHNRP